MSLSWYGKRFVIVAVCVAVISLFVKMSFYRSSVFMVKGLREFTKGGYERSKLSFKDQEMSVPCEGRSFLITGANSGLGKEIAAEFTRRKGTIHIVCRNEERCHQAAEDLRKLNSGSEIIEHILDISDIKAVFDFAKNFNAKYGKLDVLVNNAGVLLDKRMLTKDNLEQTFATNTLGPYVLTAGLLPSLEKSSDPRVLMVTSGGSYMEKLDLSDLNSEKSFDGARAYSQTKRQEIVMMEQFALKHPSTLFLSMHPGWADTPGVEKSLPSFYRNLQSKLRTPAQGIDTLIWLATIPKTHPNLHNGGYYFDRKIASKHLPLAWTQSTEEEESQIMTVLQDFAAKITGS